jgi:type II secretory pathway pseudopilin PulG
MAVPGAINKQGGMTLIEVVVSSIIMTVIAGGMFSLLAVYTREIREGVAMTRLQMQYENVASQAGSLTHSASAVVDVSEAAAWPVPSTWSDDSTNSIYIKNPDGNIIGGFRVNSLGYLQEYSPATGGWKDYKAGNQMVSVASTPKSFFLSATRKYVTLTFTIKTSVEGTSYSLSSRSDLFKCRN